MINETCFMEENSRVRGIRKLSLDEMVEASAGFGSPLGLFRCLFAFPHEVPNMQHLDSTQKKKKSIKGIVKCRNENHLVFITTEDRVHRKKRRERRIFITSVSNNRCLPNDFHLFAQFMSRCPCQIGNQRSSPLKQHTASDEGFPSWRGMKSEGSSVYSFSVMKNRGAGQ